MSLYHLLSYEADPVRRALVFLGKVETDYIKSHTMRAAGLIFSGTFMELPDSSVLDVRQAGDLAWPRKLTIFRITISK